MRLDLFLKMFEVEHGHEALINEIKKYLEQDGKIVMIDEYKSIFELIDINPMELYAD
jgi:tRNA1(Val) A37 N6-methylase TrmN6